MLHTLNLASLSARRDGFGESVVLEVGSGTDTRKLLAFAIENSLGGAEFLTGIPGTVGGAVWGNAGASGEGFAPLTASVETIEKDGSVRIWDSSELSWNYRTSPWKDTNSVLVTKCMLVMRVVPKDEIIKRIAKFSALKKGQPIGKKTAGCVFKNPEGFSAGRLLDECGCKGMSLGGAIVSPTHANFVENTGNAAANDIYTLCERCRKRVLAERGIKLEYEVRFFGSFEEKN